VSENLRNIRPAVFLLAGFVALAGGCSRPGPSVPATSPSTKAEREEWHSLLLGGKPAGFMQEIHRRSPEGNLVTWTRQRLIVRRGAEPVQMEAELEVEETLGGDILGFRLLQRLASENMVSEGKVRGDQMEISVTGSGEPRRIAVPFDRRAKGPRAIERLLLASLKQPGDSLSETTFFPEKNSCGRVTVVRGPEEEVPLPGGARRLVRRASNFDILPGHEMNEWLDESGVIWKSATSLLGMTIETHRSSAEEILREKYASPPEVFYASSVRPDRPLRDPTTIQEAVYRFRLKSGDFKSRGIEGMFSGTGQTILKEESPSARIVRIAKVMPHAAVPRPVVAPKGEEAALAPNAFIQSDDPAIVELSAKAAGDRTDAFTAAREIERWVRKNVKFKDLRTPFASAREVARRLEGDCTEHGVLLAALARAAGIPARVVSGLVYYQGSFVGHLWTEVYIDRWVPLDGTRGYGGVGPDHIALSASPLAASSAADLFLDLAQVIGNLTIEILEER